MPFYDFNAALSVPRGWMECNGSIINQTNYDAVHGPGAWTADVINATISGKYLPALTGKYLVGGSTQAGSSAITSTGNANHQINVAHTHTINNHYHNVHNSGAGASSIYEAGVTALIDAPTGSSGYRIAETANNGAGLNQDLTTSSDGLTSNSSLSATQSIQPESIATKYIMRVI